MKQRYVSLDEDEEKKKKERMAKKIRAKDC